MDYFIRIGGMDMKCKVSNWMVLSVSNNKTFVTRGYYITKKFFSTYEDAREYMLEESNKYASVKERHLGKNEVFIDCEEYFEMAEKYYKIMR